MYMPHIKFQDSSISGSRVSQLPSITDRQTDGQTDRRTDRPKPICPLNFSEVGGIKTKFPKLPPKMTIFIQLSMERHNCLIRLLGMLIFQVRLHATELPLYLVCFTSVIIVSYIVTRF